MRGKALLIIAISLGLISAFLVNQFLRSLAPMQHQEYVDVVVASRHIRTNAVLSRDMLERRQIPVESVHPEALRAIYDAQGRIVANDIVAGETVLESRLVPPGHVPGMSFAIPSDKRGVTIGVNEVVGVAGFIKPGDTIDVLATFNGDQPKTVTVLEDVIVLAIAQDMEARRTPDARVSTSVTLALHPQQVERVTLAEEQGSLRLALRPPSASNVSGRQGTNLSQLHPQPFAQGQPKSPEVVARPVQATPTASSPPAVQTRRVNADAPAVSEWVVEVIRGAQREVRVVSE